MNRETLLSLKRSDLVKLAAREGIRGRSRMKKAELVDALAVARPSIETDAGRGSGGPAGDRVEVAAREPVPSARERTGVGTGQWAEPKPSSRPAPPPLPEEASELRPPPATGRLSLVARDPDWLHAWWSYRPHEVDRVSAAAGAGRLQLRLHRFVDGTWTEIQRVRVPSDARNWYMRAGLPGEAFEAELGFEDEKGRFHLLARSRRATAPDGSSRAAGPAEFVTIPYDRLFAELLEFIGRHLPGRRDIAAALREIQRRGIETPFPMEGPPPWTVEQERSMGEATPAEAAAPASRRSWSGRPTSSRMPRSGQSSP
jgi:hypothetical protein